MADSTGTVVSTVRLTLYSRAGCHLCETMKCAIKTLFPRDCFALEEVDVDSDPELKRRYGEHIPVLEAKGHELCRVRLDVESVNAYLSKFR
jgi:hypothetical protein